MLTKTEQDNTTKHKDRQRVKASTVTQNKRKKAGKKKKQFNEEKHGNKTGPRGSRGANTKKKKLTNNKNHVSYKSPS